MHNFTGFIAKIGIKTGTSKRGAWKLYSIKIDGQDEWISAGFDAPPCKEGDYVSIEAEQNDKGYWDAKSIKQVKNAPAKEAAAVSGPALAKTSTQTSIHYQSARKDAIALIELLLTHKALPMSASATAAGTAKRYEEITALIDKLTVRYFNDAETHRILEDVTDEGSSKAEEADPTPGSDEVDDA